MNTSAITRLWRRTLLMIGVARVTIIDDSKAAQILQLRLGADETKDDTPRLAEYGFTSNPPEGSDAVVLFIAGERTNGVVIATNNQTVRMRNLATGEVAIHDDKGRYVLLRADGIFVQGNNDPVTVETTSDINATTTGGAINLTAATTIKLQADFIHLQASSIAIEAPGIGITATTLDVTATTVMTGPTAVIGPMAVTGDTTLTGATAVIGSLTSNGHDIGELHEHLPGSLHAGGTAVTGTSGIVTP